MTPKILRTITATSFALVIMLGAAWQARAQDAKDLYPTMAPLEQYLGFQSCGAAGEKQVPFPLTRGRNDIAQELLRKEQGGERGRIRTCDPCLKRALLYQLSYAPNFYNQALAEVV